MTKATWTVQLTTPSGGLLSTDRVTTDKDDVSLTDLIKRCDFGMSPARSGDVITITRDDD